jgi:hypothetical protein
VDVVVDDHLLLRILLDEEPPGLRRPGARIYTTGLWYHRLCRAVSNRSVTGVISRVLGPADPSVAASVVRAITELPPTVGLPSLREMAWPMARLLDEGVRLNLMSLEALAVAEHQGSELCLATVNDNSNLIEAAGDRGVPARHIDE